MLDVVNFSLTGCVFKHTGIITLVLLIQQLTKLTSYSPHWKRDVKPNMMMNLINFIKHCHESCNLTMKLLETGSLHTFNFIVNHNLNLNITEKELTNFSFLLHHRLILFLTINFTIKLMD